jgi:hypothetical protein
MWEGGAVRQGDRYRASHPAVQAGWSNFVPGDTPDHELENLFEAMGDPPTHDPSPHVRIPAGIPPHRQVVATADTFQALPFAPGSPGATKKGPTPPAPFGTGIKKGRVYDVGDPAVRANPGLFEFPRRDVTVADIERLTAGDTKKPAA